MISYESHTDVFKVNRSDIPSKPIYDIYAYFSLQNVDVMSAPLNTVVLAQHTLALEPDIFRIKNLNRIALLFLPPQVIQTLIRLHQVNKFEVHHLLLCKIFLKQIIKRRNMQAPTQTRKTKKPFLQFTVN